MAPVAKSTANAITPGMKNSSSPRPSRATTLKSIGPAGWPRRSGQKMVPQPESGIVRIAAVSHSLLDKHGRLPCDRRIRTRRTFRHETQTGGPHVAGDGIGNARIAQDDFRLRQLGGCGGGNRSLPPFPESPSSFHRPARRRTNWTRSGRRAAGQTRHPFPPQNPSG